MLSRKKISAYRLDAQGQALAEEEHDHHHRSPRPRRPPLLYLHHQTLRTPGHRGPQNPLRSNLTISFYRFLRNNLENPKIIPIFAPEI